MTRSVWIILAVALLAAMTPAFAADVDGKWTASFDTQIGVQNYTFEFKVDAGKLTGTAKSAAGETKITEGKVDGDSISFVENLNYEGQELKIVYKGKISGDEIKFNRNVADMANEDLVAKRVK
jgi:hypothetical protein